MAQEIVANFSFNPGDSVQKVGSVRQEMRQLKEALLSIPQDDPRWPKVFGRYTELQNHVRELNRLSKITDPHEQVKNYLKLGEAGVGAFTALRSAAVLFGGANEDTLKKIAQVEAAMGLLQGLKAFDEGVKTAREMFQALTLTNRATKIAQTETKVLGETQVASAEATEGATLATKGLGIAMKGIGIGLIIAAVAYLVDNWKSLTKSVGELIPGLGSLGGMFDRLKQIVVGVGSVIFNLVAGPIRAVIDVIKGNFSDALNDVKKMVDIVGNFEQGVASSKAAQAADRRKEELQKEIEHLDDIIAIKKEKGQDTYKLELQQLNDKKELYAYDEKELKKVNHEIEILMIDHHKKLAEEAKIAAQKAAELAKKEAEREQKIAEDHLKRQLEIREKEKEEKEKEAEELLKETTDFLKKGDELDEDNSVKKLARLNAEFAKLKTETIAAHGDLIAIEISYDKQKSQLQKDIADGEAADRAKAQQQFIDSIKKANQETLENTKLSLHKKEEALRANIAKIKELLKAGTIDQKVADNALAESAKAQQQLDKEVALSKKESVAAIGGALNALSGVVNKKSAEGKAIAVGQATINAYQGFSTALASAPPPFNFIEAGAVLVAGLENVRKIVNTKVGSSDTGGGNFSIAGTGGAGLQFNAPAIPQSNPTTNLSQESLNQINSTQQQAPIQTYVVESQMTAAQQRQTSYNASNTI